MNELPRPAAALPAAACAALLAGPACGLEFNALEMPVQASAGFAPDSGRHLQTQLELEPAAEIGLAPGVGLRLSARLRLDARDRLAPGKAPVEAYASLSRPLPVGSSGTLELRDAYVEWRRPNGILRIGKQQVVWGRLDGIKVLDVLNPQDFREFIVADLDESRIGLWSAYADFSIGAWRTELAVLPDATGHAIPKAGAWFALTAPRFRFGADVDSPALETSSARPGHSLSSAAVGLRLSRRVGALDLSAVAYTGSDPEPLGRLVGDPGPVAVERYHRRREVYGGSAEQSFGRFALRAEYAWQPDRFFNIRSAAGLGSTSLSQHRLAVGIDVDGPLGVFVNAQFLADRVAAAPRGLVRPAVDRVSTLFLRRSFAYETVRLEFRWYRSWSQRDDLLALQGSYQLGENTTLEVRAESFSGAPEGLFGQFSGRDRITVGIEHIF